MKYFPQEKYYTCGCAVFRMVLSQYDCDVPTEEALEKEMHTSLENVGTSYEDMILIGEKYGFDVIEGENGNLSELDKLIDDGWTIVLGISLDVPHFVVYLGNNGNHIFLNDPYRGEKSNFLIKKFLRNNWVIDHKRYLYLSVDFPELDFNNPELDRNKYWIGYRKKYERL